ncbi:MAG: hypothetical protein M1821_009658 [Bathelium mastoideum]|nr:MAG: hypothetical protein M1821_009658 [Bathelium mastoideum]KAI9690583.1 MAG: hypothetical protein M1822_009546 [Bathelium mastoideum]
MDTSETKIPASEAPELLHDPIDRTLTATQIADESVATSNKRPPEDELDKPAPKKVFGSKDLEHESTDTRASDQIGTKDNGSTVKDASAQDGLADTSASIKLDSSNDRHENEITGPSKSPQSSGKPADRKYLKLLEDIASEKQTWGLHAFTENNRLRPRINDEKTYFSDDLKEVKEIIDRSVKFILQKFKPGEAWKWDRIRETYSEYKRFEFVRTTHKDDEQVHYAILKNENRIICGIFRKIEEHKIKWDSVMLWSEGNKKAASIWAIDGIQSTAHGL